MVVVIEANDKNSRAKKTTTPYTQSHKIEIAQLVPSAITSKSIAALQFVLSFLFTTLYQREEEEEDKHAKRKAIKKQRKNKQLKSIDRKQFGNYD